MAYLDRQTRARFNHLNTIDLLAGPSSPCSPWQIRQHPVAGSGFWHGSVPMVEFGQQHFVPARICDSLSGQADVKPPTKTTMPPGTKLSRTNWRLPWAVVHRRCRLIHVPEHPRFITLFLAAISGLKPLEEMEFGHTAFRHRATTNFQQLQASRTGSGRTRSGCLLQNCEINLSSQTGQSIAIEVAG